MADNILTDEETGIMVDSYCGPVIGDGSPRIRYQIARPPVESDSHRGTDSFMTLSYPQMRALAQWVLDNWHAHNQEPRRPMPFTFVLTEVVT